MNGWGFISVIVSMWIGYCIGLWFGRADRRTRHEQAQAGRGRADD